MVNDSSGDEEDNIHELLMWLPQVKELPLIQKGISEKPNGSALYCKPEKAGSREDCSRCSEGSEILLEFAVLSLAFLSPAN